MSRKLFDDEVVAAVRALRDAHLREVERLKRAHVRPDEQRLLADKVEEDRAEKHRRAAELASPVLWEIKQRSSTRIMPGTPRWREVYGANRLAAYKDTAGLERLRTRSVAELERIGTDPTSAPAVVYECLQLLRAKAEGDAARPPVDTARQAANLVERQLDGLLAEISEAGRAVKADADDTIWREQLEETVEALRTGGEDKGRQYDAQRQAAADAAVARAAGVAGHYVIGADNKVKFVPETAA